VTDALSLNDVRRRFGRSIALDGLSLSVRPGEIYGFLGRNGAGKTTTLRILTGVLHADSGTVEVLGQRVRRVPVELKRRIGSVSQEQNFYPWMTGRELGRFVAGFYPTWDAAEFMHLAKLLDVPLEKRAMELSGGTRTKLGLAIALSPRPDLLLLDEPTTGLDPVARREFNDLVSAIVKERGCTAFLSSHLVDEVQQVAHRVGIIHAGKMRIEGQVPWLLQSVRRLRHVPPPLVAAPIEAELSPPLAPALEPLAAPSTGTPVEGHGAPLPVEAAAPAPPAVAAPAPFPPPGFERIRGDVFRAAPALWETSTFPPGTVIESLSLEDVFLAFARTDAVASAA
jgi:ABC-2 type transport system ATP-binding protein